ncbi:hypothetical protein KI387_025564, partial [Taxus chinensis]
MEMLPHINQLIEWDRRAKVLINEIISRYENYWQRDSLYAAADPNLLSHGDFWCL